MSPYPNVYQIEEIYASRHNPSVFNTHLADSLHLSVPDQDFHLGGHYHSIQAYSDGVLSRVGAALQPETGRVEVVRVIGGGESAWAAIETLSTATSKYDKPYHLELVDLVRFNSQGKIAQMKIFKDTAHAHKHVDEDESEAKQGK